MPSWTPGPWTRETPFQDEFWGVAHMLSNGVMVFEEESYARNAKNWEADLRLASLAPELAELLQRISGHVVRLSGGWDIQQDIDSLLARARGEDAHA